MPAARLTRRLDAAALDPTPFLRPFDRAGRS